MFANEELTDLELNEMLAAWIVPDPPQCLRARVFSETRSASNYARDFAFEIDSVIEKPWYKSLISNVHDLIRPLKLPPLKVTSKPIEVGTIWGAYRGSERRSGAISVLIHVGAVALLLAVFQSPAVRHKLKQVTDIYFPVEPYKAKNSDLKQAGGGGGGGQHQPQPVNRGRAPRFAPKQFVPPAQSVPKPVLPTIPTITAQAPQIVASDYGDPLSKLDVLSGGTGSNGLGAGSGGGIGPGHGDGYGPGFGSGIGGGVYRIGGDVSQPTLVLKIEPEYSEQARKAKYSGTVLLSVIIDANGTPRDIHVVRPLGLGLDEKAVEAVSKWRFHPAMKGGKAVAVLAQVEVNFRLL